MKSTTAPKVPHEKPDKQQSQESAKLFGITQQDTVQKPVQLQPNSVPKPQSIEQTNNMPQSHEQTNNMPQSNEQSNNVPQPQEQPNNIPPSQEQPNNMPKSLHPHNMHFL